MEDKFTEIEELALLSKDKIRKIQRFKLEENTNGDLLFFEINRITRDWFWVVLIKNEEARYKLMRETVFNEMISFLFKIFKINKWDKLFIPIKRRGSYREQTRWSIEVHFYDKIIRRAGFNAKPNQWNSFKEYVMLYTNGCELTEEEVIEKMETMI